MRGADDADLLKRSGAGDQSAFTELMDRHADAVYRLLRSLGASEHDAEDAALVAQLRAGRARFEANPGVRARLAARMAEVWSDG